MDLQLKNVECPVKNGYIWKIQGVTMKNGNKAVTLKSSQ